MAFQKNLHENKIRGLGGVSDRTLQKRRSVPKKGACHLLTEGGEIGFPHRREFWCVSIFVLVELYIAFIGGCKNEIYATSKSTNCTQDWENLGHDNS